MIQVPDGWPQAAQIAVYQAAARAEAVLTARRASNPVRALFWKVFRQRIVWEGHRVEANDGIIPRKRLAEIAGCSASTVTSGLRKLREAGMIFWGYGGSHRYDTPLMLNPAYYAKFRDSLDEKEKVIPRVIHRPSTLGTTAQKIAARHYKDLPSVATLPQEERLYSDPARSARLPLRSSTATANGKRPHGRARPRWSTGERLAAAALGRLGPPPPS